MSLDMYLSANKAVVLYKNGVPFKWKEEGEEIGYWCKFNALHDYIVDQFNGGEDNCGEIWLTEINLLQLIEVLKKVDKDNSLAPSLLPTRSGLFFGSVEYDEWYFERVKSSIEVFTKALEFLQQEKSSSTQLENGTDYVDSRIVYQASW